MYISKVRVFCDSKLKMVNLLMVVETVPTQGEDPKEAMSADELQSRAEAASISGRLRRWWSRAKL